MLALLLLRQIALALLSTAVACGLGRPVLRRLKIPAPQASTADTCEELFFAATCGLGLCCVYVAALSALGLCYRPLLWLVIPAGLWGLRGARPDPGALRHLLIILLLCAPMLLCTLLPPYKQDDVTFHLPYARLILQNHGLVADTHLRYPDFPLYGEMLLVLGLSLDDFAAQLMSWLCLYLLAAGVFATLLRYRSAPAAWLGVVAVLANRLLCLLGTLGYVDISLSLFVLAAALAFHRWSQARPQAAPPWLALCGGFIGLAVGIKYTALVYAAALFALILVRCQVLAALGLAWRAALVGGCWYLRSLIHTGNPVFPFLRQVFGLSAQWSVADYQGQFQHLGSFGPPKTLLGLLRAPFYMAFIEEMGGGPLEVSPLLWLGLLGLAITAHRQGWLRGPGRPLWLVPLLYAAVWFLSINHVRYFTPNLALLAILAGAGLWELAAAVRRPAIRAALLVVFVGGGLVPAYVMVGLDLRNPGLVPVTPQARAAYLSRQLPDYAGTARAAARPGLTYGLYLISRYYGEGRVIGDAFGRERFSDVAALLDRPQELLRHLQGLGVSGLLINTTGGWLGRRVALGPPFRLLYEDPHTLLYEF